MEKITRTCHVLLFLFCSFFVGNSFASSPLPDNTITIGDAASALIGSEACFRADIANTGTDTGFGPYFRLILPADLTLASAKFLGQALNTDVLGVFPASPGNQIADTRASNANVSGTEGNSLTNLVLPLGSLSQGGPTITTDICVVISNTAELALPLDISLQPVLQYGDTATGDNGAIIGTVQTAQITPTLMTFNTANNAPAGKQVPGTTFGLNYSHTIDVAENQSVTSVDLSETFSADLSFNAFNPATPNGGIGCAYGAAPGTDMTMSCASIFGTNSGNDVTIGYSAHINDILDEASCANQTITQNSTLDGSYNSAALPQTVDSNSVSARHLTLIKNLNATTFNPSDTVTVSGTIRVSDFATVNSLSFTDQIPDGLTYVSHTDLSINGGGSVAIVPTSTVHGDGSSEVSYDLSAVSGNITGGSLISYTYTVIVDASYNDAEPVLASDGFTINGTATYSLTAGAANCTDDHSAAFSITAVTFSTEVVNPQAEYYPGDVVTFRLNMSVPSGDTQSIQYTTYFPLPVFDVSAIDTTFNNDVTHSATDTLGLTPNGITVDAATNALIIDWPDVNTASAQVLSVDVDIVVTDDPFADNLYLTTLFSGQASNTPAVINSDMNPVQNLVRNAELSVVSGISAISEDGSLNLPASNPAESDASGVDAGDTVTQHITITNDGGATAYKINISQPDLANLSGYTLTGATLNGGDISGNFTGSLSTSLVLDNSVSLPAGQSIILTYSYQVAQTALAAEVLQPEVSVTWSASVSSGTAFPAIQDSVDISLEDINVSVSATGVSPEGNTGKLVVGDVVTYQADIYIPEGKVTDLVVGFSLPEGMEYVFASSTFPAGFAGTQVTATEVTIGSVASGQTRQFTFTGDTVATNNNNAADNTLVITLDALVKDDAVNLATSTEQAKNLNVSATYQGASGSKNDTDNQSFTEHQLAITTSVTPSSGLQAGDMATVSFVVTNNGTAPAYDVSLGNTADSSLFDLTSVATGSGGCSYANPNFSCTFSSIAVGASQTVSYTATVQDDVQTGASFTINGAVSGDSQSGVVAEERDHASNDNGSVATQALAVNALSVIASSETFTATSASEPLAIGEAVTYELIVDIPEGVSQQTTNSDFISFSLPAGLQYIANSALIRADFDSSITSVTLAGVIPTTDAALEPTVDNADSISGQTLSFDLGNIDNNDDDASTEQIIITITALVLNTDTNTLGHSLVTTGAVNYLNQAAAPQSDSSNHSSIVMLPIPALTHTASPSTVEGGNLVTFTLVASNTANANSTNGFDWAIQGSVPAILNNPSITSAVLSRGSVDVSGCASFSANALSVDGSCLAGGQQGAEHYLAANESITVTYTASVDSSVGFEQTIDNTMNLVMTSLPASNGAAAPGAAGSDTGERIGDNSNNDSAQAVNDLVIMKTASITSDTPTLNLTVSEAKAAISAEVILTADFAVPVGTSNNFTFTLDLPAGLSYQNEAITINLPASNFSASISPSTTPGVDTDPIVLDFGTIVNSAATAQTISVEVAVVINNELSNQNTTTLTATGSLGYSGAVTAPQDTAVVTVIEPNLTIDQLITGGNVGSDAGDTVSYQSSVTNTASDATAYNIELSDLLPSELLGAPDGSGSGQIFSNISIVNPTDSILLSGTTTPLDATHYSLGTTNNSNDTLNFTAFNLAPGETLVYSYDVIVANNASVGATVTTMANAKYNSLATGGRNGDDGTDDDINTVINNYVETDSSNLTLSSSIAIQHNLTSGQVDANFAIGETVSLDVRVDLSEGITGSVIIQQQLDSGLDFVSASVIAAGHINYNGAGTATESPVGTITVDLGDISNTADANGSNDYIIWRIVAQINDDSNNVAGVVINANASVTSDAGNAGPQTLVVNVVEPNLVVTVTPSSATTSIEDEVTFTILVAHSVSGADAFDAEINLVIPDGLTYVAGSFSGQGTLNDNDTQLLNIDLSSIALSDSSKTFSFRASVDTDASVNNSLTVSVDNTSTYSSTSGVTTEDRIYNLTGSGSTIVNAPSFIDAQQSVSLIGDNGNGIANAGETLQYTIVLTNNGTTANNVVYQETIPNTSTLVVGSLTTTNGSVDENNNHDLLVDVGSMNNGDVVTISYQILIDNDAVQGTEIVAQGSVDSEQTISELSDSDGDESNGDQPSITQVGGQATVLDSLYVQQLADWYIDADNDNNVSPGDTLVIRYYIQNRGDSTLTNVTLVDTISNGLSYVAASAFVDSGTININSHNISINIATLDSGEQILASVTVTIDNPMFDSDANGTSETFVMQADINSNETDLSKADQNGIIADGNQATRINAVTGGAGSVSPEVLQTWSLSDDVDSDGFIDAGDEVTYWLTVVNQGAMTANNVKLSEIIPTNTTLVSGSVVTSQGLVLTESPVSINLLDIAPSQLVTLSYKVIVNADTANGTVVSAQADLEGDNFTSLKSDDNATSNDGINPTLFTVNNSGTSTVGAQIALTDTSDNTTSGNNYIQGESLMLQAIFTMPAGITKDVVFDINIPAGLVYQESSAVLSHSFDTGLNASYNPANINNVLSGTEVSVDNLLNHSGNNISLVLGSVINSDNDGNDEQYTLSIILNSATSVPTAVIDNRIATASANFLNNLDQSQISQSPDLILALLNRAPVAVNDSDNTDEDTEITLNLITNDFDFDNGQSLIISAVSASENSAGISIAEDGNSVTFTPANDFVGDDSFNYTLLDSAGGTSTATVTVTLHAVQDAPVAVDDSVTINEDSSDNTITILTNDSDVDGDLLTVTLASSSHGQVSINSQGTLNYTPDANFNGTDIIVYSISDGNGGSDTAVVTVTVTSVNDAPVAIDDSVIVNEDSSNNTITILTNDSDVDGDLLTVTSASSNHGQVSINSDGTLNYTPSANFNGTDTITYSVSDGNGGLATATVTITVTSVNDAPIAVDDSVTINEDSSDNTITILTNDSDADGDSLTITSATSENGQVTINGNGALNYTPNANFNGTDIITYSISDGNGGSDTAVVTVTVPSLNDAPIAVDDSVTIEEDSSNNTITILTNDSDVDGDLLTVTSASSNHGQVSINSDGTLNYTPSANFNGTDTITYSVSDGNGGLATATVTITVTAVNDAPIAVDDSVTINEDSSDNTITILTNDSDADGDSLTITSATSENGQVTINGNGALNYTPNANFNGTDTITYSISDGNGGTDTAIVTITVSGSVDSPIAENDSAKTEQGVAVIIDVLANDSDPDGDTLTVTAATSSLGSIYLNADGSILFTPNLGFNGEAVINYSISDNHGGIDSAQVSVVVEALADIDNTPPTAVDDAITILDREPVNIDVLANDFDLDGHEISLQMATAEYGRVEVSNNSVIYTPEAGVSGDFIISYSIVDELNAADTARVIVTIDLDGPVITLPPDLCEELTVNSDSLYTRVNLGEASAVDRFGNTLPVSLVNGSPLYPPGLNEAYWKATDADGNTTIKAQKVCVNPLISLEKNQIVLEGQPVSVGIYLNGSSPIYPVVVPYSVSGSANEEDHDLLSGEMTIEQGTDIKITFTTFIDGLVEEHGDVVITLSGDINMGNKKQHITTISKGNIAPEVELNVNQNQQERLVVSQQEGLVIIEADVYDPNIADYFDLTWTSSNSTVVNISEELNRFIFDPEKLSVGLYQFTVAVLDSGEPQLEDKATVYIEVVEQLQELSGVDSDGDLIPDNVEGYKDMDGDGVADYLDRIEECNVLPEKVEVQNGYLIEGEPGVCLRRGYFTVGGETNGAEITTGDISDDDTDLLVEDTEAENIGGVFDYIAYGIPENGTEYAIVMPQIKPIPQNAVYRKLYPDTGWGNFTENETNSLWSTAGEPGYCPPPNSDKDDSSNIWTPGLVEGNWCVQMIIEDGGANDDDGEVNGNIVDPGGVGVMLSENHQPIALDDKYTMFVNETRVLDVINNDSDEDGDALLVTSAHASIGTVTIVDNQLQYQSLTDYDGDITINYGITDEFGGTDHAVVTIDIISNVAPIALNDYSEIEQGQTVDINLLANDSDDDGDLIMLDSVDSNLVSFDTSGNATFTPEPDQYGEAVINYTIIDRFGHQASAQWLVTIIKVEQLDATTSGGSVHYISLFLLMLMLSRRERKFR